MISPQTATGAPQSPTLTLTAAFEGIEGSYSHAVLDAYAARRGVVFAPLGCSSYRAVAQAVLSGQADRRLLASVGAGLRKAYSRRAEIGLQMLSEHVDTLITIPNQKLLMIGDDDLTFIVMKVN